MTRIAAEPGSSSPAAHIIETAAAWPGVTTPVKRRGATAIVLDGEELGHVHLDRGTLDLPLGDERRARILDERRARPWVSNWVSKAITTDADAADGLVLLRESYDAQRATALSAATAATAAD